MRNRSLALAAAGFLLAAAPSFPQAQAGPSQEGPSQEGPSQEGLSPQTPLGGEARPGEMAQSASEQERGGSQALPRPVDLDEANFARLVSDFQSFSVTTASLAVERTPRRDVHEMAERLVAEGTEAEERLTAALEQEGVRLPGEDPRSMPHYRRMAEQLRDQPDASFDTRFLELQLLAHRQAEEILRSYAETGDRPALVDFSTETLAEVEARRERLASLAGR